MIKVEDLAKLKGIWQKRLNTVVGNRGIVSQEIYTSYEANHIIFIVEPTTHDILPVELEIRKRLPVSSTECRIVQSYDDFHSSLEGRMCLIVKFDIEYVLKASNEHTRLGIVSLLFLVFLVLLYRHLKDYDFDYFRYLTHHK